MFGQPKGRKGNDMKFKRVYHYGVEKKMDEDDYVCAYKAENGVTIEVVFLPGMYSIMAEYRTYKVGSRYFETLKSAKQFVESM